MTASVHTPVSPQVVRAVIRRHDLRTHSFSMEPWVGGGSCVYRLGEAYVLKVPHSDAAPIASLQIEAVGAAAARADPAVDFSGIALGAIPFVLAGYREIAPLPDDATAEARILWYYLRLALFGLRRAEVTESERYHRSARLLSDTHAYLTWARLA